MTFLDTGILVGVLLEKHPEHAQCRAALEESEAPFTDAHSLASLCPKSCCRPASDAP